MSVQRSGLNLSFGEFYKEHRYINCAKYAQRPLCSLASGLGYLAVTDDAYPTEFTTGVSFTVYIPPDPGGGSSTYVAKWKGQASYSHASFGTTTSSSRTAGGFTWTGCAQSVSTLNGRMTFTVAGGGQYASAVTLKGDGTVGATNRLTEFVVCRADEEDLLDAGQVFRPAFLSLIAAYRPAHLRFMDSQLTNTSVLSNWSDRPRSTALTVHYQPWIRSKIVSGNANPGEIVRTGTDVYSANSYSGMPVSYQHGETVHGHVIVSNTTTTPTLNVGGRGAKVVSQGALGALTTAGTNFQTQMIAAGTTVSGHLVGPYTFTFDAFYDQWVLTEGDPDLGQPIEELIALCNATGTVGGWFCIPVYASDDFVTQLGNTLTSTWTSTGPILIEWGNEIWNTAGGFPMTSRVAKWGDSTFTSPQVNGSNGANYSAYYGLRFAQVAAILRPIFSSAGKSSLLKMVLASRGGAGDTASNLANEVTNVRLQNTNYASISGANAPVLSSDYLSYALYHRPPTALGDASDVGWSSVTLASTLKTHVDAWIANNTVTTGFDWLRDTWINDATIQGICNTAGGRYDNYNTLATTYGKQIALYEYNHQVDAPSSTFATANSPWNSSTYGDQGGKINQFLLAFFASVQWKDANTQLLTYFYNQPRSLSSNIYAMCTTQPWLTFPRLAPLTDTIGGDTTQTGYGNWQAHLAWNNKTTRTFRLKN